MLPFRFFLPITASDFASSLFSTKINFNFLASFVRLLRWTSLFSRSQPLGCSLLHRSSALHSNKISCEIFRRTFVAVRTGLEPATLGVSGRYSNQLNYRTNCSDFSFFQRECKDIAFYDTYNILLITFSKNI